MKMFKIKKVKTVRVNRKCTIDYKSDKIVSKMRRRSRQKTFLWIFINYRMGFTEKPTSLWSLVDFRFKSYLKDSF